MVDNGIKPVYVFDGKPPTMKAGELEKRKEKREEAQVALDKVIVQSIWCADRLAPGEKNNAWG